MRTSVGEAAFTSSFSGAFSFFVQKTIDGIQKN